MTDQSTALNEEIETSREIPSVSKKRAGGVLEKILIAIGLFVMIIALIAVNGGFSASETEQVITPTEHSNKKIRNILGDAPELPPEPIQEIDKAVIEEAEKLIQTYQPPPPPPPPVVTRSQNNGKEPLTPEERKRMSGLLITKNSSSNSKTSQPLTAEEQARRIAASQGGQQGILGGFEPEPSLEQADGLGAKLTPTRLSGVKAGLLKNRDMFITTGTFLNCALETAISSDLAGMTSCRLTQDVYSTSGKVVLLERGSRITGQYQGGLKKGQARIFVLWNRVETPHGVIVNLDSPSAGPLGRSGNAGFIDTHFWKRFGGAMLLSLVDDLGAYVSGELTNGGTSQFGTTVASSQSAASIALENSINIPPTLIKNQGDQIVVFVARDLDFRGVYELKHSK